MSQNAKAALRFWPLEIRDGRVLVEVAVVETATGHTLEPLGRAWLAAGPDSCQVEGFTWIPGPDAPLVVRVN